MSGQATSFILENKRLRSGYSADSFLTGLWYISAYNGQIKDLKMITHVVMMKFKPQVTAVDYENAPYHQKSDDDPDPWKSRNLFRRS